MKEVRSGLEHSRAFTVIELMIAVTVLGVLLALAIPSFLGLLRDARRSSAVNDLLADMTFARSEAARRGRVVAICPNTGGDACGTNAEWGQGWIVFESTNGDVVKDTSEPVLRRASGRTTGLTLKAEKASFDFRPFNRRAANFGSVHFCDPRGATHSRSIVVPAGGAVRVATASTTDCP